MGFAPQQITGESVATVVPLFYNPTILRPPLIIRPPGLVTKGGFLY